jgi:membrane-associated phospholipid phosphatase
MAADNHYATDVIVGSIAGAALGFAVPWLHGRAASGSPVGPPRCSFSRCRRCREARVIDRFELPFAAN